MELSDILLWRYATKAMNGQKVNSDKIERILDAIRYAPTSNGLQPFEIIVISNNELREKLQPVINNQQVVTGSSHLIIFAAWDNVTPERVNRVFDQVVAERGNSQGLVDYRQFLLMKHTEQTTDDNFNHAARQAYIGLGFGLIAAANEMVDATPMEGFDPLAVDKELGLPAKGLRSVAMMAVGYRDAENDWLVNLKKVRRPVADFVTVLK
ncbi:nitroreductase family protein [Chitinophaga sp. S165]|uniref:nitroreductase family protein n=1 Tax=Chitinophaga sp. S165 TaxID=2135462 RepID=UPI000D70FF0E|nr:nitroreductase family protein [Chitinophaga sp. S165]PWV46572.1 nitroreductase [Chitinophaga sp. S165]